MTVEFDKYDYNPVYWHVKKYLTDPNVRYIYVYGGSSAGKTYSITQLYSEIPISEEENMIIFRKESTTIWKTVYNDFKKICTKINECFQASSLNNYFDIKKMWINTEKNIIDFAGMDDPEKVKGISSYKYIFLNELSKFDYGDHKELRRRMRGIEGQTVIFDWNPISKFHWIKTLVIDRDEWVKKQNFVKDCPGISLLDKNSGVWMNKKGNSVLIKTTYRDNFWIVGHPIPGYGFIDQNTIDEFEEMRIKEPYDYQVYGMAEWGTPKRGGEFLDAFDYGKHVKQVKFNNGSPLHVSIDNNVLPYIAMTIWQMQKTEQGWDVKQTNELPAREPHNSATKAGTYLGKFLKTIHYTQKIYLYGDPTTKARNTIDDENKSFLNLFKLALEKQGFEIEERFMRKAPPVSITGDFINALLNERVSGVSVEVDETCTESINDYMSTKKDKDGGMLKEREKDTETGLSWEKNGHLLDTARYFLCKVFDEEFKKYNNRFAKYGELKDMTVDSMLTGGF